jgi:hypothetical protein
MLIFGLGYPLSKEKVEEQNEQMAKLRANGN